MRTRLAPFIFLFSSCCLVRGVRSSLKFPQSVYHKALLSSIFSAVVTVSPCQAIEFVAPDLSFSFHYPNEFQVSEKMMGLTMKTHEYEVLLKSRKTKGLTAGLTIDKVKIDNIREFSSPEALGKRVIDVEIKKGIEKSRVYHF